MSVLFLQADPVAAEVRILPLLDSLRSDGLIQGYARVDRDMSIDGDIFAHYDVVLAHRNPNRRQIEWLRKNSIAFVYDIDDLLLLDSSVVLGRKRSSEQKAIAWCLTNARRVTSPSRRLLAMLDARLDANLAERSVYLPNTGAEAPPPVKATGRPRLLWVSSAVPTSSDELNAICRGLASAADALDTDIVLLGRFPETVREHFRRYEHITWLSHGSYRKFLAGGSFIAVAPLSTALPVTEQSYVDCKSDIKAADFGSNRIAAAYSPAPPYTESDLPCYIVPANTAAAWREAIVRLAGGFPNQGNQLAEHPAFRERRPSVVARQLLQELLGVHRLSSMTVKFDVIRTPRFARVLERKLRQLRLNLRGVRSRSC